jgi:zona occludens toxin
MLYLITGANGAGKTLNTLKWVRERQLKENRPVCHNGRFEPVEGGELSSWKKIDMKEWQSEPDGTIFLVDECHNDFPLRPPSGTPPDYVRMLAEHRRRGFDFYLVTQHPQNIDSFVRRLIGPPGWHRHLKRSFGVDMVSVLEWSAVNPNCEKDGSGKNASVSMQAYPKDVYGWYKSASLHTGKKRIPAKVWVLVACVIAIPVLGWFALSKLPGVGKGKDQPQQVEAKGVAASGGVSSGPVERMTVAEYLTHRKPRLPDFPHTAPAYDEVTKPAVAPYPAACVSMGERCDCYTQQGTYLRASKDVCLQIVKHGFFVDWQAQLTPAANPPSRPAPLPAPAPMQQQQAAPVINVHVPPMPQQGAQLSEWAQGLAARNAQVRSELGR